MQSLKCEESQSVALGASSQEIRLFRNDWGELRPPAIGEWTPRLPVSVVVPAAGEQPRLGPALAALAAQTYPEHLIEVVVVAGPAAADAHGSAPPLPDLPEPRPANCRVVRAPAAGLAAARAYGAHASTGEILCWLDADLIAGPRHIEAHARWLHCHPGAATLGRIQTAAAQPARPRAERLLERTRELRDADHLGFAVYAVPGSAVSRHLYEQVGGLDPALAHGQDTEFGYRLWQAGAVLIPERRATARRTGSAAGAGPRPSPGGHHLSALADALPQPRSLRAQMPGRGADGRASRPRPLPLVRAAVSAAGEPFERVRACVDRLLASGERDLAVTLVAPWESPDWELRLIQAHYLTEERVTFSTVAPLTAFPSPYLLDVPARWGVGPRTVARLLARADRGRAGLVELSVPDRGVALRLWRTRALSRALRVRRPGESRTTAVAAVHGRYRIQGGPEDITDLAELAPLELASPGRTAPTPPAAVAALPVLAAPAPSVWSRALRTAARWYACLRRGGQELRSAMRWSTARRASS